MDHSCPLAYFTISNCDNNKGGTVTRCRTTRESPRLSSPQRCTLNRARGRLGRVRTVAGVRHAPVFLPVVYSCGYKVIIDVPLFAGVLTGDVVPGRIHRILGRRCTKDRFIGIHRTNCDRDVVNTGGFRKHSSVRVRLGNGTSEFIVASEFSGLNGNTDNTTVRYVGVTYGVGSSGSLGVKR